MTKPFYLKFLSITLSLALVWTSGNLAQAVAVAPDVFIAPSNLPQFQFQPPGELGRVVDYFNADPTVWSGQTRRSAPTMPLVILIQDLHAHYGVQKNISSILDFLSKKLSSSAPPLRHSSAPPFALAVEGAEGPIDSSVMALYPDEKVKRAAADYLMREGELTGAEYFAIQRGLPHLLVGAENKKYYLLHRDLFRKTLTDRNELVSRLKTIQSEMNELPRRVFHKNRDLWEFQKKVDAYDKGEMSTHDFIGMLVEMATHLSKGDGRREMGDTSISSLAPHPSPLNIKKNFPTLAAFAANSGYGTMDQIRTATAGFLTQAQDRFTAQERKDLQALAKNKGATTYYLYLRELIYKKQLFLAVPPELAEYLEYLHTAQTMGMDRVVHEARELAFQIKLDLARDGGQTRRSAPTRQPSNPAVDLVQVQHDLDLLLRLADLQATEYEVRDFAPRLNQFVALTKSLLMRPKGEEREETGDASFDDAKIRQLISSSVDFYVMALVRNKPMIDNTLALLSSPIPHPPSVAVLIAGGFHTLQLAQMLREKNISYLVINPTVDHVSDKDHALYIKRLNGQHLTTEEIFSDAEQKSPEWVQAIKTVGGPDLSPNRIALSKFWPFTTGGNSVAIGYDHSEAAPGLQAADILLHHQAGINTNVGEEDVNELDETHRKIEQAIGQGEALGITRFILTDLENLFEGTDKQLAQKLLLGLHFDDDAQSHQAVSNLQAHLNRGPTARRDLQAALKNAQEVMQTSLDPSQFDNFRLVMVFSEDPFFTNARLLAHTDAGRKSVKAAQVAPSLFIHERTLTVGQSDTVGLRHLFQHEAADFRRGGHAWQNSEEERAVNRLWDVVRTPLLNPFLRSQSFNHPSDSNDPTAREKAAEAGRDAVPHKILWSSSGRRRSIEEIRKIMGYAAEFGLRILQAADILDRQEQESAPDPAAKIASSHDSLLSPDAGLVFYFRPETNRSPTIYVKIRQTPTGWIAAEEKTQDFIFFSNDRLKAAISGRPPKQDSPPEKTPLVKTAKSSPANGFFYWPERWGAKDAWLVGLGIAGLVFEAAIGASWSGWMPHLLARVDFSLGWVLITHLWPMAKSERSTSSMLKAMSFPVAYAVLPIFHTIPFVYPLLLIGLIVGHAIFDIQHIFPQFRWSRLKEDLMRDPWGLRGMGLIGMIFLANPWFLAVAMGVYLLVYVIARPTVWQRLDATQRERGARAIRQALQEASELKGADAIPLLEALSALKNLQTTLATERHNAMILSQHKTILSYVLDLAAKDERVARLVAVLRLNEFDHDYSRFAENGKYYVAADYLPFDALAIGDKEESEIKDLLHKAYETDGIPAFERALTLVAEEERTSYATHFLQERFVALGKEAIGRVSRHIYSAQSQTRVFDVAVDLAASSKDTLAANILRSRLRGIGGISAAASPDILAWAGSDWLMTLKLIQAISKTGDRVAIPEFLALLPSALNKNYRLAESLVKGLAEMPDVGSLPMLNRVIRDRSLPSDLRKDAIRTAFQIIQNTPKDGAPNRLVDPVLIAATINALREAFNSPSEDDPMHLTWRFLIAQDLQLLGRPQSTAIFLELVKGNRREELVNSAWIRLISAQSHEDAQAAATFLKEAGAEDRIGQIILDDGSRVAFGPWFFGRTVGGVHIVKASDSPNEMAFEENDGKYHLLHADRSSEDSVRRIAAALQNELLTSYRSGDWISARTILDKYGWPLAWREVTERALQTLTDPQSPVYLSRIKSQPDAYRVMIKKSTTPERAKTSKKPAVARNRTAKRLLELELLLGSLGILAFIFIPQNLDLLTRLAHNPIASVLVVLSILGLMIASLFPPFSHLSDEPEPSDTQESPEDLWAQIEHAYHDYSPRNNITEGLLLHAPGRPEIRSEILWGKAGQILVTNPSLDTSNNVVAFWDSRTQRAVLVSIFNPDDVLFARVTIRQAFLKMGVQPDDKEYIRDNVHYILIRADQDDRVPDRVQLQRDSGKTREMLEEAFNGLGLALPQTKLDRRWITPQGIHMAAREGFIFVPPTSSAHPVLAEKLSRFAANLSTPRSRGHEVLVMRDVVARTIYTEPDVRSLWHGELTLDHLIDLAIRTRNARFNKNEDLMIPYGNPDAEGHMPLVSLRVIFSRMLTHPSPLLSPRAQEIYDGLHVLSNAELSEKMLEPGGNFHMPLPQLLQLCQEIDDHFLTFFTNPFTYEFLYREMSKEVGIEVDPTEWERLNFRQALAVEVAQRLNMPSEPSENDVATDEEKILEHQGWLSSWRQRGPWGEFAANLMETLILTVLWFGGLYVFGHHTNLWTATFIPIGVAGIMSLLHGLGRAPRLGKNAKGTFRQRFFSGRVAFGDGGTEAYGWMNGLKLLGLFLVFSIPFMVAIGFVIGSGHFTDTMLLSAKGLEGAFVLAVISHLEHFPLWDQHLSKRFLSMPKAEIKPPSTPTPENSEEVDRAWQIIREKLETYRGASSIPVDFWVGSFWPGVLEKGRVANPWVEPYLSILAQLREFLKENGKERQSGQLSPAQFIRQVLDRIDTLRPPVKKTAPARPAVEMTPEDKQVAEAWDVIKARLNELLTGLQQNRRPLPDIEFVNSNPWSQRLHNAGIFKTGPELWDFNSATFEKRVSRELFQIFHLAYEIHPRREQPEAFLQTALALIEQIARIRTERIEAAGWVPGLHILGLTEANQLLVIIEPSGVDSESRRLQLLDFNATIDSQQNQSIDVPMNAYMAQGAVEAFAESTRDEKLLKASIISAGRWEQAEIGIEVTLPDGFWIKLIRQSRLNPSVWHHLGHQYKLIIKRMLKGPNGREGGIRLLFDGDDYLTSGRRSGASKPLGLRNDTTYKKELEDLEARHSEFVKLADTLNEKSTGEAYGDIPIFEIKADLGRWNGYHFIHNGHRIVVINDTKSLAVQGRTRRHEYRELHLMAQGLSERDAHIIVSHEERQDQDNPRDGLLTIDDVDQLLAMTPEQLQALLDEYTRDAGMVGPYLVRNQTLDVLGPAIDSKKTAINLTAAAKYESDFYKFAQALRLSKLVESETPNSFQQHKRIEAYLTATEAVLTRIGREGMGSVFADMGAWGMIENSIHNGHPPISATPLDKTLHTNTIIHILQMLVPNAFSGNPTDRMQMQILNQRDSLALNSNLVDMRQNILAVQESTARAARTPQRKATEKQFNSFLRALVEGMDAQGINHQQLSDFRQAALGRPMQDQVAFMVIQNEILRRIPNITNKLSGQEIGDLLNAGIQALRIPKYLIVHISNELYHQHSKYGFTAAEFDATTALTELGAGDLTFKKAFGERNGSTIEWVIRQQLEEEGHAMPLDEGQKAVLFRRINTVYPRTFLAGAGYAQNVGTKYLEEHDADYDRHNIINEERQRDALIADQSITGIRMLGVTHGLGDNGALAAQIIRYTFLNALHSERFRVGMTTDEVIHVSQQLLKEAVEYLSEAVDQRMADSDLSATLGLLIQIGSIPYIIKIGDARIDVEKLGEKREIAQLTDDHTLLQEALSAEKTETIRTINDDATAHHPERNILTRSLQAHAYEKIPNLADPLSNSFDVVPLMAAKRLFVFSAGLMNELAAYAHASEHGEEHRALHAVRDLIQAHENKQPEGLAKEFVDQTLAFGRGLHPGSVGNLTAVVMNVNPANTNRFDFRYTRPVEIMVDFGNDAFVLYSKKDLIAAGEWGHSFVARHPADYYLVDSTNLESIQTISDLQDLRMDVPLSPSRVQIRRAGHLFSISETNSTRGFSLGCTIEETIMSWGEWKEYFAGKGFEILGDSGIPTDRNMGQRAAVRTSNRFSIQVSKASRSTTPPPSPAGSAWVTNDMYTETLAGFFEHGLPMAALALAQLFYGSTMGSYSWWLLGYFVLVHIPQIFLDPQLKEAYPSLTERIWHVFFNWKFLLLASLTAGVAFAWPQMGTQGHWFWTFFMKEFHDLLNSRRRREALLKLISNSPWLETSGVGAYIPSVDMKESRSFQDNLNSLTQQLRFAGQA